MFSSVIKLVLIISISAAAAFAQTTSFVYQGKLQDSGVAANGSYQFQFKLFDAAVGGNQIGLSIEESAAVTTGIFAVNLNFGAGAFGSQQFRFLEIGVRMNGSGQPYTVLNPRQQVTSTPYAIRSLSANEADHAVIADDSGALGGIPAAQYVITTDSRMSDARTPLPNSVHYIQNGTLQQAASNFNVSGEGKADKLTAMTQFNIGPFRVLFANNAFSNTFAGINAGNASPTGDSNSFFGANAGKATLAGSLNSFFGSDAGLSNTSGNANSFFGRSAGKVNTVGAGNSFFGTGAGVANVTGSSNSFFGTTAGAANTASDNSFFGYTSGYFNTTGGNNAFFGKNSGFKNTTGAANTAIGSHAGLQNTTGNNNVFVGYYAGQSNTTESLNTFLGYNTDGVAGITNATAIGANAVVTQSNTMVLGTAPVTVQVPGSLTVANTFSANILNSATKYQIAGINVLTNPGADNIFVGADSGKVTTGGYNAFVGSQSGKSNTTGSNNSFFGAYSGYANTTGTNNAFFGANTGLGNIGSFNAFFGSNAGFTNWTGVDNSFFGNASGLNNTTGSGNSFFGRNAGKSVEVAGNNSIFGAYAGENTTTGGNAYFGAFAGQKNTAGSQNVFVGINAGKENTGGTSNTFIGANAGQNAGALGNNNTALGANAKVGLNVSNAMAIGANAFAATSNEVAIGNSSSKIMIDGTLTVGSAVDVNAQLNADSVVTGPLSAGSANLGSGNLIVPGGNGQVQVNGGLEVGGVIVASAGLFENSIEISGLAFHLLGGAGSTELCYSDTNPGLPLSKKYLAHCSSSIRYKENVQDFSSGLDVVRRLRPVTYNWKSNGNSDLGFIAEEVNKVEPLLSKFNEKGEVEGVKYAQITTVLVNAVKEQQLQIEQLQSHIKELKAAVCLASPSALVCQPVTDTKEGGR